MNGPRSAALVGNPNAGKSALFNALTGARQKIANYPGVTVERKAGRLILPSGAPVGLTDLPGSYGLHPNSPDEEVTRKVILGEFPGEAAPQVLVIVLDASNLEQHLVFALELIELGRPTVVALNMIDLAERDGLVLDPAALEEALGVPVIPTVAVRRKGLAELAAAIAAAEEREPEHRHPHSGRTERRLTARAIAEGAILSETRRHRLHARLDQVLLHPWLGPLILFALLFVMFQAVFAGAAPFQEALQSLVDWISAEVQTVFAPSLARDLVTDGVLAGVGAVVVFLPQIVILFFFILALEASGYMARAAFLMDRLMAQVGLSGRSFIPLLSSFACAVPGIMATRSISDPKDRLTTILIAPLMTCSARWPVYTMIIGAFVPRRLVANVVNLQGLVAFGLLIAGIVSAMAVALALRASVTKGAASGFIMELPKYQMPNMKDLAIGLWQRAWIFLRRAGTIIFTVSVVLWLLLNFPRAGEGQNQVDASVAGHIANGLAVVVEPIGFNRDIALALIPAMAAREVAVSSLATTYAVASSDDNATAAALGTQLTSHWSLATALAFLAWFVFAPQCMSTIAVTRRETNGWKWPLFMLAYLFALAYIFAGLTYWFAVWMGLG
ncbi:MAG: ferrous iron transporter B [Novosphingobium sp.]